MTVYVDDMQRHARVGQLNAQWSHLIADTEDELHAFAARLGLKRAWHQKPGTPLSHYDVTEPKRQLAIRLGARPIGYMGEESKDLIRRKIAERDAAKATAVAESDEDTSDRGAQQVGLFGNGGREDRQHHSQPGWPSTVVDQGVRDTHGGRSRGNAYSGGRAL